VIELKTIIEPFRIKSVEAIRFTDHAQRAAALASPSFLADMVQPSARLTARAPRL
jgi:hypothetical protein